MCENCEKRLCQHEYFFNQNMGQAECKKCGLLKSTIEAVEGKYEVRNTEIETVLRRIGEDLKRQMPPNVGFTLLMFDYGENGNMFYLSSAQRADMIKAMEEFLSKNK